MLKLASHFHLRTMLRADLAKAVSGAAALVGTSYDDEAHAHPARETAVGTKPVDSYFAVRVGWRLETYGHKYC